jgi:hypothetical protein
MNCKTLVSIFKEYFEYDSSVVAKCKRVKMQSPSITILMKAMSKESNASYFYFPNELLSFINLTTTTRVVVHVEGIEIFKKYLSLVDNPTI